MIRKFIECGRSVYQNMKKGTDDVRLMLDYAEIICVNVLVILALSYLLINAFRFLFAVKH